MNGDTARLAYFEWSLDAESPEQVDLELPRDLEQLAAANPAVGIRISSEYLEAEWRELDSRTHAVERGGVGDWPPVDGSADHVIPVAKWDALVDDPANAGARMLDPVCFAFDVTPDRSASSIVAAGRRADGDTQVEVTEHRPGTSWVPGRLAELVERHGPVAVMCDAIGPAGSLIHLLEAAGVVVEPVSGGDYARAFGAFLDAVDDRRLRHLGGQDLRQAVRGASKRPLGDGAFAWGRRSSMVDISPLVAATLAVWGSVTVGGDEAFAMAW